MEHAFATIGKDVVAEVIGHLGIGGTLGHERCVLGNAIDHVVFHTHPCGLAIEINAPSAIPGSQDCSIDDRGIVHIVDQVVENLVAGSTLLRASDVVVERPAGGCYALHNIPDMIELTDDLAAVFARASILAYGYA